MRFTCKGVDLFGSLHEAGSETAVLIVAGGGQVRAGPQRLFARLGAGLAAAGHPVLRFDRRGIGDSGGIDAGFTGCGSDIAAAAAALREHQPQIRNIIGLGLCDGATAMLLAPDALDGLILLNPWVIEDGAALPAGAVEAHYRRRLLQPAAWLRLLKGSVNIRSAFASLLGAARAQSMGDLESRVAATVDATTRPMYLILSSQDRTADAFRPLARTQSAKFASSMTLDADHAFSSAAAEAKLIENVTGIVKAW
ncbi:MAG: hydrolase 1, exosortase A system-associated [Pacificimonas sp.]